MNLKLSWNAYRRVGRFIRLWTLKEPFIYFGLAVVVNALWLQNQSIILLFAFAIIVFILGSSQNVLNGILLLFSFIVGIGIINLWQGELNEFRKMSDQIPQQFAATISIEKVNKSRMSGLAQIEFPVSQKNIIRVPLKFVLSKDLGVKSGMDYFASIKKVRWNKPVHPDDFNEKSFYHAKGYFLKGKVTQIADKGFSSGADHIISRLNQYSEEHFAGTLDENSTAIIKALFTGNKNGLDEVFLNDFRHLGLMHLFAVSGFHVGLLFAMILRLFTKIVRKKIRILIAIFFTWLYIAYIGFPVSAIRAGMMLTAGVWGMLNGRRLFSWANFWLAFFLILILMPGQIYAPGFVLSFSALSGILFFLPTINHHIYILRAKERHFLFLYFVSIFEISLAAQLGVLLPASYWFGGINIISPILNVLMVPLVIGFMTITIPLAFLAIFNIPFAATILALFTRLISWLGHVLSPLYWPITLKDNHPFFILLFAILALWYWQRRAWFAKYLNYGLILTFAFLLILFPIQIPIEAIQLDVGQGDACLIKTDRKHFLVDAGNKRFRFANAMKSITGPFEKIFITHADVDHYGGLLTTSPLMDGGELMVSDSNGGSWYRELITNYRKAGNRISIPKPGIVASGAFFRIYCLDNGRYGRELGYGKNNRSLILLLVTPNWSYLLTGDAEFPQEKFLIPFQPIIKNSILKVGHHGSRKGTSDQFLNLVSPPVAVISCGFKNKFGHPHSELIHRLNQHHTKIYRTDVNGFWQSPEFSFHPLEIDYLK